jgi:hypothetical protein
MPENPTKGTAPLYLEIPLALRERLAGFVRRTRRTLKGEVCNAIEQYLDREEALEASRPPPHPAGDQAGASPAGQNPPARKGRDKGKEK